MEDILITTDDIKPKKPEKKLKMKKSIFRNIIEWIIYLIIFGAIAFGTPKVLSKVLDTPYPIASITSSSMWPALKEGDLALIQGVTGKNDIKVGDIVVYLNASATSKQPSFTIHRVVAMNENTLVTKGDANNVNDQAITYDKLIGKTINIKNKPVRIPYLGKISIYYQKLMNK